VVMILLRQPWKDCLPCLITSQHYWSLTWFSKSLVPTPVLTWWLRGWRQPSATTPSKTSRNCQDESPWWNV
jgi:hypothetical protein